ncbi:hypothetical protein MPH_12128 [Macrophomina phaseolina MS6]|uniref:Uncharacterized protein n=1 Tax=Macrophomina phaseolina (strain MS6) TaxID=1126212 RepID=K2S1X8_MACPH|nr:hypothetical protein MPH_12128 [Macrophomina phaseolina MS6]
MLGADYHDGKVRKPGAHMGAENHPRTAYERDVYTSSPDQRVGDTVCARSGQRPRQGCLCSFQADSISSRRLTFSGVRQVYECI